MGNPPKQAIPLLHVSDPDNSTSSLQFAQALAKARANAIRNPTRTIKILPKRTTLPKSIFEGDSLQNPIYLEYLK